VTTVLHVEDDEMLANAVKSALASFGFRGDFLIASTIEDARRILAAQEPRLDLVISDMDLGDGTGLEVIRAVRSSAFHAHVPILILSGQHDPSAATRAYALGANAYVLKSTRSRTTAQVVRTIYDHWLQDVRLPAKVQGHRTRDAISRIISIRSRVAQQYMNIAERFENTHDGFWMSIARREGNMANLTTFLREQAEDCQLPDDVLDGLEHHQRNVLRVLDDLDARPPATQDDAFRSLLDLSTPLDSPSLLVGMGLLFPVAHLAIGALLESLARSIEMICEEIEARTSDPSLLASISQLRSRATALRSLSAEESAAVQFQ
jgi:DNA-binding NarL/FixJ family response regulator